MNHHQLPISKELYEYLGEDYIFIQTEPMEEERVNMGWGEDLTTLPFMRFFYLQEKECRGLIDQADVVILGDEKNPEYKGESRRKNQLSAIQNEFTKRDSGSSFLRKVYITNISNIPNIENIQYICYVQAHM
jgi:hypothetical protein